jgi:undecaprenyl-diphosphatase
LLSDGDERLAPLYFATAVVVATSRVYVRIHHASDVVGGMAVGRVLGLIGKRLAPLGDRD